MTLEDVKAYLPVLRALVELHAETNGPVKSNEIAFKLGKSAGTIRGILNTLSKMGYVTGIPGPKGGYIPTTKALMALKAYEKSVPVRAWIDKHTITLRVEGISIYTSPGGEIIAEVKVETPMPAELSTKKTIHIEATYAPIGTYITGEIAAVDPNGKLEINVHKMVAMPQITADKIATRKLITGKPDEPIKSIAKKMADNFIRAIPILKDKEVLGMFACQQLAESVSEGMDPNEPVNKKIAEIPTLNYDTSIRDIIKTMDATGVGRILLLKNDEPIGIVTRTDVLRFIVSQYADFEEGEEGDV